MPVTVSGAIHRLTDLVYPLYSYHPYRVKDIRESKEKSRDGHLYQEVTQGISLLFKDFYTFVYRLHQRQ